MLSNNKTIGKKIKELRIKNWEKYSQWEIANILWINRVSLSLIENWERELKEEEIKILSEIFEIDDINYFKVNIVKLNKTDDLYNFKRVLLYVLNKVKDKKNVWKTVLYKLLYFIEFNHFEKYWDTLLGIDFIKWPKWPVPLNAHKIFNDMEKKWQIDEIMNRFRWFLQYKLLSNVDKIDLSDLWKDKLELIDNVISKFWDKSATWISEYSHGDMPYKATKEIWDIIPKELVFYRTSTYSITEW